MFYLHNHTDASNLRLIDCIIKTSQLIEHAVKLGAQGVAITDHESLSNHIKAIKKVKEGKKSKKIPQEFKLILGNEIYLIDDVEAGKFFHFVLLAKDEIGHRQLRELSSLAWDNSYYTGKMQRVPTFKSDLARVVGESKGHLIASTACLGGELPYWILQTKAFENIKENEKIYQSEVSQYKQNIKEFINFCLDLFGEDFYLEMQPSEDEEQVFVNKELLTISSSYKIPLIITTDSHYLTKEDSNIHAAYLNSKEEEREVESFYATTYMMEESEIYKHFDYMGEDVVAEALENTIRIGNKVKEYDLYQPTIVPSADIPEFELQHIFKPVYEKYEYLYKYAFSDSIYDRYLLKLIEDGFLNKVPYNTIAKEKFYECIERIHIELEEMWKVTEKIHTSISSYYLTTLELIEIMWNEGDSLVGVARGSITGMYTMYLIGLIQMNPIEWNLPHWRHISSQKAELSDVDIDTQANRRSWIIEAVKKRRGERKVLNCCTFKTEGSKSAIITAGRGLGIDPDVTSYIANMIPITRGFTWSLKDCVNGNEEEERRPVREFINECSKYEGLLEVAMGIEGLISGRSIHASAVYLFNDDFLEHNARMKAPNGTYITQFDMKDSDYCSGLKMDFLTIEALDKIRKCMDFLVEYGYMEWQGSLKATYDKYLHPDVLDYDTPEMWDWVAENKVVDLFQFDTQVGLQAAQRIKPHNLVELATANSIMRLMVSEEGAEQPIDTYIRYKNDINEWYKCMREDYKLTENEIKILEKYLLPVYGVGDTQEIVMEISMDEKISGFNVSQSNRLRKGISKKDKELQAQMKEMFFEHGMEIKTSENLLNYIWKEVIERQLGYSFSKNHTFPYSVIGLQELNLAYHYPIIYWNTSCLTVNAGADEEIEDNKSTEYGKIATAISNMQQRGINVELPLINEADFGFLPDEKSNRILFGLKGINGIGDETARLLIENRPYMSMQDFYKRMIDTKLIKPAQMVKLIKAGCFTEIDSKNRQKTMRHYIENYLLTPCEKLTMLQLNKMQEYEIIPKEYHLMIRFINFKKYVLSDEFLTRLYIDRSKKTIPKSGYHDRYFELDEISMPFFQEYFSESSIVGIKGENFIISEKKFTKEIEKKIIPLREWFNKQNVLDLYNSCQFNELWNKYAVGTISKWEMESLSFYYSAHELKNINEEQYGIVNFFDLPEDPTSYDYYPRFINGERKMIPKYNICRLAGTVLDTDKNKHTISLLTCYGVVSVKFNKGQFLHYHKTISERLDENSTKKTVLENSWFKRGNKIFVCGYRQDHMFRAYRYSDTIYQHTVALVEELFDEGSVLLNTERVRL